MRQAWHASCRICLNRASSPSTSRSFIQHRSSYRSYPASLACCDVRATSRPRQIACTSDRSRSYASPSHSWRQDAGTSASDATGRTIVVPDAAQGEDIPFRQIKHWFEAPYPTELVPIRNASLRSEVFRQALNDETIDEDLPAVFYHKGLEHRGDALAYLIADETCAHFFGQYHRVYGAISRKVYSSPPKAVDLLVQNVHWTVLAQQLRVGHPSLDYVGSSHKARLADNWEAYLYALFLDQGFDTVARFLVPIYLAKLYSMASVFDIELPQQVFIPEPPANMKPAQQRGVFTAFRNHGLNAFFRGRKATEKSEDPPKPTRLYYDGFALPHWLVPCSDGAKCQRTDCYFVHPDERGEWPQPEQALSVQVSKVSHVDDSRWNMKRRLEGIVEEKLLHYKESVHTIIGGVAEQRAHASYQKYERLLESRLNKVQTNLREEDQKRATLKSLYLVAARVARMHKRLEAIEAQVQSQDPTEDSAEAETADSEIAEEASCASEGDSTQATEDADKAQATEETDDTQASKEEGMEDVIGELESSSGMQTAQQQMEKRVTSILQTLNKQSKRIAELESMKLKPINKRLQELESIKSKFEKKLNTLVQQGKKLDDLDDLSKTMESTVKDVKGGIKRIVELERKTKSLETPKKEKD